MKKSRLDVLLDKPNATIKDINEIIEILEKKGVENLNDEEKTHLYMAKELKKVTEKENENLEKTPPVVIKSKEKQAFEIIKENEIELLEEEVNDDRLYRLYINGQFISNLTKEKFDLLKEVFEK